jgi:gliding motility-associated-like protein
MVLSKIKLLTRMDDFTFYNIKRRRKNTLGFLAVFLVFFTFSSFDNISSIAMTLDTDKDGVVNSKDIDDDGDGIIDANEDANLDKDNNPATNPTDSDKDGIPNYLDIDSDNDGILDNVEAQTTNGFIPPCGIDSDGNGLDDHYEETPGSCGGLIPIDTDKDKIPDYLDIDSDNDGILDNVEAQQTNNFQEPCGFDSDENGLDDHYESHPGNGEGITPIDTDQDHHPDFRDIDSDNDGVLDNVEAQETNNFQEPCGLDSDGNGLDDHYESHPGNGEGITPIDTDEDHHPDFRDIDSDSDGILDNVEAQTAADFQEPCGLDSDGNGLDDHYESAPGNGEGITPINSDADSFPNFRDIDSDNDGIPDNVEAQTTSGYVAPSGSDDDNDGLDNAYEGAGNEGLTPVDTDVDNTPDYLDLDSDNDLVPDNNEGNDFNFDGIPDQTFTGTDTDGDGLDDGYEGSDVNDGFDVNDEIDDPANDLPDTDGDATTDGDVNYRDLDDDGDSIDTPDEDANNDGNPTNDDTDDDGTPDYLDPNDNNVDTDGDGVTDTDEDTDGTDPTDPCDFLLSSQTVTPSDEWIALDCDGDGVTNGDEVADETDPLDGCDFNPESITLVQSGDYLLLDCDGDGVTNGDEITDGTSPFDSCDFLLASQTLTPSDEWIGLDCDGDGVTNGDELTDGTSPLDACDYNPESITLVQYGDYLLLDCDGDGVTNGDEITDGTDPLNSCDFILASQTLLTSDEWENLDCDGDGVINSDELIDETDPLDPCDLLLSSQSMDPTNEWNNLDCDNDGNPNGTDPNPLVATAVDDSGTTMPETEVIINILENDDYLPNNDPNNLGTTSITRIGGDAIGTVSFDSETGELSYIPDVSETDTSVTIIYEACNIDPEPDVCASATVTIVIEAGTMTIDAVDDNYSIDFIIDNVGGIIEGSNVLDNDTLNGESVDLDDVTITSIPTNELRVNENGTVTVIDDKVSPGTYTIEYTICEKDNPNNCDTAIVTVTIGIISKGPIEVNQLVTPNSDGKNDFLFIRNVDLALNNSIKIFNRWGKAVYEGRGYNNQNNVFDGKSKVRSTIGAGDYLPAGVYFYIFEYTFEQKNITESGYIYISQ